MAILMRPDGESIYLSIHSHTSNLRLTPYNVACTCSPRECARSINICLLLCYRGLFSSSSKTKLAGNTATFMQRKSDSSLYSCRAPHLAFAARSAGSKAAPNCLALSSYSAVSSLCPRSYAIYLHPPATERERLRRSTTTTPHHQPRTTTAASMLGGTLGSDAATATQ